MDAKIKKMIEKLERRKNNTKRGIEEFFNLIGNLQNVIDSRINENDKFNLYIKLEGLWLNFNAGEYTNYIGIIDGKFDIYYKFYYGERYIPIEIEDVEYINYAKVINSLEKFLDEFENLADYENELDVLKKLNNVIKEYKNE